MWDALIVGGGPAGLAAATWLARYRRTALVVDAGEYRNRWTDKVHGYLALDPCSPRELLARARADLDRYGGVTVRDGLVTGVARTPEGGFTVGVAGDPGQEQARSVILATGMVDAFPEVDGFLEHYGASVFHCLACDGYEARGRDVVVLGWSENTAGFAMSTLNWASSVTVVTEGRRFEGDDALRDELAREGVVLLEDDVVAFRGTRGDLRGAQLRSGGEVPCSMAFFSIAHAPRNELAAALGCAISDEGCVLTDLEGRTSVRGVYAAGDLTPGTQLVQIAAAKGAAAGITCAKTLLGDA